MSFEEDLHSCTCEFREENARPFYFKHTGQEVMLITSVPSFQAVYRQLASIRFYRHIFLALFGANPTIDGQSLISFFEENIYWTHYNKCYIRKDHPSGNDFRNPPELCRIRHLNRELSNYKPKIAVIFGSPIIKRLANKELKGKFIEANIATSIGRIPCICTDFPSTGCEEEMLEVRKRLKRYIPAIDDSPVPKSMISDVANTKDTFSVHAKYELDALRAYWNTIKGYNENNNSGKSNIDHLWIGQEVIPKWIKYSFIITCCSFIEDQISALLAENQDLEKKQLQHIGNKLKCEKEVLKRYGDELFIRASRLLDEIQLLRYVRNAIAHAGGRIYHGLYKNEGRIDMVKKGNSLKKIIDNRSDLHVEPSGMIIVTENFCEHALKVVERFVDYITQFNTKY